MAKLNKIVLYSLLISITALFSCTSSVDKMQIVRSVLDQYQTDLSSKSAMQIARNFHPDATIMAEGKKVVKGTELIKHHFQGLEEIDFKEEFIVDEVIEADGYLIVQTQNIGVWKNLQETEEHSFELKGQMIMTQAPGDGRWKIFRYAYSSNASSEWSYPNQIKGKFAHIVLFWLKEPENESLKNTFRDATKNFINNLKYARSMHIGTPAETKRPVIDSSYTFCLIVTFDSKEEQDRYQIDEEHLNFIDQYKGWWNRVLIYDSVMI